MQSCWQHNWGRTNPLQPERGLTFKKPDFLLDYLKQAAAAEDAWPRGCLIRICDVRAIQGDALQSQCQTEGQAAHLASGPGMVQRTCSREVRSYSARFKRCQQHLHECCSHVVGHTLNAQPRTGRLLMRSEGLQPFIDQANDYVQPPDIPCQLLTALSRPALSAEN